MIGRRLVAIVLVAFVALEAAAESPSKGFPQRKRRRSPIESKVFLSNWWDYYNRATRRIDSGDFIGAEQDLREAIKLRPEDSAHARAYGVRFQEYYPHLELGILLYDTGRFGEAVREIQTSLKQDPNEEAYFFLHEAQRRVLLQTMTDQQPPEITALEPASGLVTSQASVRVRGAAKDDYYVDTITVNGRAVLVGRAKQSTDFEMEIPLSGEENRIPVAVTDLAGRTTTQVIVVEVDRQGPVFSLERVRRSGDGRSAALRGAVYDRNLVSGVSINGQNLLLPGNANAIAIDQDVRLSDQDGRIHLALMDGFGNSTLADLDPRIEVGTAGRLKETIQLAARDFNPAYLLGSPARSPKVAFDGIKDRQRVFLEEVYVDGWVDDSTGVREVLCNQERLEIPAGRHLYFGYLWGPLKEGTNTLEVKATNLIDEVAMSRLEVSCDLPTRLDPGQRLALVHKDFEVIGKTSDLPLGQILNRAIRREVLDRGRFDILAQQEALVEALREREIGRSPLADSSLRAPDESIRTADLQIEGQILEYQESFVADISVSSVQSPRVLFETSLQAVDKSTESIQKAAAVLALKLEQAFPLAEGEITLISPFVRSTLSKRENIQRDMQVIAFRRGPEEFSGNQRSLGFQWYPIGPLTISRVLDKYSELRAGPELREQPVVGDLVVTR